MTTVEYSVTGELDKNNHAVYWTGTYNDGNQNVYTARNNPILTACFTGIISHLRATRGQRNLWNDNIVTGKVSIDGNEWICEFKNGGWRLYNDSTEERDGYLTTILERLATDINTVSFSDMNGSAYVFPIGGGSGDAPTKVTNTNKPDAPAPQPDPDTGSSSGDDMGFGLFD